jgi:hypothetical protein
LISFYIIYIQLIEIIDYYLLLICRKVLFLNPAHLIINKTLFHGSIAYLFRRLL